MRTEKKKSGSRFDHVEQTTLKSSTPITQVYQTCKTVTTTLYKSQNAENKSRNN